MHYLQQSHEFLTAGFLSQDCNAIWIYPNLIEINPYKKFRAALVLFTLGTWSLWYSAVPERKTDRDHLLQVQIEPDCSQYTDFGSTASPREAVSVVTMNGTKSRVRNGERGERREERGEENVRYRTGMFELQISSHTLRSRSYEMTLTSCVVHIETETSCLSTRWHCNIATLTPEILRYLLDAVLHFDNACHLDIAMLYLKLIRSFIGINLILSCLVDTLVQRAS